MPIDRDRIVEEALQLLNEVGIDKLSTRKLAERLGVQQPALYWHFKNRDDLVRALYERSRLPLDELQLEQMQAARQDGIEALGNFLLQWCQLLTTNSQHGQIWQVFHRGTAQAPELSELRDDIRQEHEEWLDRIGLFIKTARKQKQIKLKEKGKEGLQSTAANLMVLIFGLIDSQLTAPALVAPDKTFEPVIKTYLRGMQA